VHSALGERPIAWPALLRYAYLLRPDHPGIAAQTINVVLMGLAAAVWGVVAWQVAGAALAGWLMATLLLVNGTTLLVSATALTEPLYALELGLLVLALCCHERAGVKARLALPLAGALTALIYLTRPTGPLVAVAVIAHLLFAPTGSGMRARGRALGLWAAAAIPLLALWHFAVWRAWGSPFHSLTTVHLKCMNITEGMFAGWGREWPSASAFFASHWREIGAKVFDHVLDHTEVLLTPSGFGLLAPLAVVALVQAPREWRPWAVLWLLAAGHWAGAVVTWATTEPARLTWPAVVCLLPLMLGAGARILAESRSRDVFGCAATAVCATTLILASFDMGRTSRNMSAAGWPAEAPPVALPMDYNPDSVVCTDSPFELAYQSDLAIVIMPFDVADAARVDPDAWLPFIKDLKVGAFALRQPTSLEPLQGLIDQGTLRLLGTAGQPEFILVEVVR
jgi:hypothetical protein